MIEVVPEHLPRAPGSHLSSSTAPRVRRFTTMEHVSNVLFIAMHAALLLVPIVPLSGRVLAFALASYGLRMLAVTAGYHGYFAHRSYKTSRAWQFVLATLGATTMQNGPIWWASVHRRHHKNADGPGDPHSPVHRGFWYAHLGWVFDRSLPLPRDESNVRDLMRYPELRWLDRHEWAPLGAYALICFLIGGLPGLVWGFVVSTLAVFHATMLINSVGHLWGWRRHRTGDQSRNNPLLALLTLGEGWHNNHHFCMTSARHGFVWWEIDCTYYSLKVLSWLRIVWDLREPPLSFSRSLRLRNRAAPTPWGCLSESARAAADEPLRPHARRFRGPRFAHGNAGLGE